MGNGVRLEAVTALEAALSYRFKDRHLLDQALTHASHGDGTRQKSDNEKLEFLGDRVLGLMVAEALMQAHPLANEGELSARLHELVSRATCADVARQVGLGAAMRLAIGEARGGGRDHPTILGDGLEALMGAVYLEAGFDGVRTIFGPFWSDRISNQGQLSHANPKSFIQEWVAARRLPPPHYEIISRSGPDHAPHFVVALRLETVGSAQGEGHSRQKAEKQAAQMMIAQLTQTESPA